MNMFEQAVSKQLQLCNTDLHPTDKPLGRHSVFIRARAIQEVLGYYFNNRNELEMLVEDALDTLNGLCFYSQLAGKEVRLHGNSDTIVLPEYDDSTITGEIMLGQNHDQAWDEDTQDDSKPEPLEIPGRFAGFSYRIIPSPSYDEFDDTDDDESLLTAELMYQVEIDEVRTHLGRLTVYVAGIVGQSDISFDQENAEEKRNSALTRLGLLYTAQDVRLHEALSQLKELLDDPEVNSSTGFQAVATCADYILNSPFDLVTNDIVNALLDYIKVSLEIEKSISVTASKIYEKDSKGRYINLMPRGAEFSEQHLESADLICMHKILKRGVSRRERTIYLATTREPEEDEGEFKSIVTYIPLDSLVDIEPRG